MKKQDTYTDTSKGKPNALIHASSPYLLQHAHNPVDWMEWGKTALEKAGRENKLLIISIGYAACHWCHVMEHESFEDEEVAELMNGFFVNVKVDREQRPDIDAVYMNAAQLCSGRGGWPLNVIALPDGKPVWAATYFPKTQWIQILNQFALTWEKTPEELREHADTLTQDLRKVENTRLQTSKKHAETPEATIVRDRLLQMMDIKRGGLDKSPKFPLPNIYTYLLTDYFFYSAENSLKATNILLVNMASGGIYDQLGGGFSRYSVDEYWFAPHFEKMLYDNGQLLSLYAQAYQLTGISLYHHVISQTVDWLKRDMLSPEGGFYTALDADSEGEEGKFYCWEEKEINDLVPASIQEALKEYYTILPEGNWEGKNILYIGKSRKQVCEKYGFSETVFVAQLEQARKIMLDYRETQKIKPALDDKILAGWNGLAIAGLVDAFSATGESEYLSLALRAAGFVKQYMQQENGRLYRNYKNGKPEINAFLEDYAFMIMAYIKLYEVSGNPAFIKDAETWMEIVETGFAAPDTPFYFYTHHEDPELVARTTEVADNVIPASNSQMALNLFRMGNLLYREEWIEKAKQMLEMAADGIHTHPAYHSNWAILSLLLTQGMDVVAITGENAEEAARKIKKAFRPNILLAFSKDPVDYPPVLEAKGETGKTMVYICRDKVCDAPMEWNTGTE